MLVLDSEDQQKCDLFLVMVPSVKDAGDTGLNNFSAGRLESIQCLNLNVCEQLSDDGLVNLIKISHQTLKERLPGC